MGSLILNLVPLALGAAVTPLAVVAVVVVLLSQRALVNGTAFLVGWFAAVVFVLVVGLVVVQALDVSPQHSAPTWIAYARIVIGAILILAALWVWRRGHARVQHMAAAEGPADVVAAAAPRLPGWLHSVESFRPGRCVLLGAGLCLLNPVDVSCIFIAALDISQADVTTAGAVVASVGFVLVASSTVAGPVAVYALDPASARPKLKAVRTWIAGNNRLLNAGLLLFIGALQVIKGIQAL